MCRLSMMYSNMSRSKQARWSSPKELCPCKPNREVMRMVPRARVSRDIELIDSKCPRRRLNIWADEALDEEILLKPSLQRIKFRGRVVPFHVRVMDDRPTRRLDRSKTRHRHERGGAGAGATAVRAAQPRRTRHYGGTGVVLPITKGLRGRRGDADESAAVAPGNKPSGCYAKGAETAA